MKRYLLIGAICLFGISDCFASGSSSNSEEIKQMCASLGFTVSSKALCNNKAFPCPRGNWWKCDETATVGDIKYSSNSSSAGDGWLICNGNTFDPAKYPELYKLIGNNFGGSTSAPQLPNYFGKYLRSSGTVTVTGYGMTRTLGTAYSSTSVYSAFKDSTVLKHSHKYPFYSKMSLGVFSEGNLSSKSDFLTPKLKKVDFSPYGSGYTCLNSIALVPYIYAGQPAK